MTIDSNKSDRADQTDDACDDAEAKPCPYCGMPMHEGTVLGGKRRMCRVDGKPRAMHSQYSLRSLLLAVCGSSVVLAFAAKVGVELTARLWLSVVILSLFVWAIAYVITETRGRIQLLPVVFGAFAIASCFCLLAITICSLDVTQIDVPNHPKLVFSQDTETFRSSANTGIVIGLISTVLGSWHHTGKNCRPSKQDMETVTE